MADLCNALCATYITVGRKNVKEGSSGGDDLYFVEQLLEHKIVNKKTSYLIKWLNYDLSANSWEPESNIGSGALKEYWMKVSC